MAKKKAQALIQTTVPVSVRRDLDALVKAASRTRADYLRRLIIAHVKAVNPETIKGIEHSWQGIEEAP
jgi:predicted DNA-binding protein